MKPSILFFIFFAGLVLEARGSSNSEQEDEGDDLLRLTLDMNPDNNFDDIARELRKALASLQKSTKQKQPMVHKVDGECINDPCIAEADVRATITVYGKHFKSSYHVVLHSQKSDLLSIEDPDFIICEPINRSERHIHCQVHVLSATSQEYNIYLKTESEITYTGKQLKVSVNQYEASDLQNSEEIGGLSFELEELCSRVFSSRKIDSLYKNLGVKPIRGIILYGEPGTGKTLVARTLARSLKAIRTDVINGPSLMSKYVGDSESNVRAIFSKAEKDYKSEQQNASLHVLIIDEMDAVLRPRGGDDTSSARSSYDSVTTQFLALMDGYEYLPNILLIGLTNKISGIDHALLRPGRFELHLHIPIPTRQAREEIFNVHIRNLRAYNHVSRDLDVAVLAEQTLNFTGADIEGTVRAAVSHAILRDPFEVNYSDFILAIDEVRNNNKVIPPDFIQYGIIPFGNRFEEIIQTYDRLHSRLITSTIQNTVFVIEGRDGSGSTSLASFLGMKYNPASIRLVSTANMIGFSNKEQEELLSSIFEEAVNTSYSVIILDKIEEIISAITSSGAETRLVQRLNMLLKAPNTFVYPGAQARINLTVRSKLMLIITTRQLHKIQASGLHIGSNTHVKIQLDPLTITEQDTILQSWKYLSNEQLPVFASEARKYLGMKNIPIKYLLEVLEYSYALQCEEKLPSPRNNLFRNKAIENLNEEQCDFDVKYLYEVLSIFSSQLIQKIEHKDLEEI